MQTNNLQSKEQTVEKKTGRPKKRVSAATHPTLLAFLDLFGLKGWNDNHVWTQNDLMQSQAITRYFTLRPQLLTLSYPLNYVRKIKIENPAEFTIKDLITLLNQFANLYGYSVKSYTRDQKPTTNGLTQRISYQVYHLSEAPA